MQCRNDGFLMLRNLGQPRKISLFEKSVLGEFFMVSNFRIKIKELYYFSVLSLSIHSQGWGVSLCLTALGACLAGSIHTGHNLSAINISGLYSRAFGNLYFTLGRILVFHHWSDLYSVIHIPIWELHNHSFIPQKKLTLSGQLNETLLNVQDKIKLC